MMDAICTRDPNRILLRTSIGDIQAWGAPSSDVSVVLSVYANVAHADTQTAYISQNLNMSAAEARRLAATLVEAADHADKVRTDAAARAA
ncbi:hypothetical protein [Reyranella sp.]|uniref:hypothetical protein n=1 Tax=Reyranella sp. TaxID=1929291 RepID=UPI004035A2C1